MQSLIGFSTVIPQGYTHQKAGSPFSLWIHHFHPLEESTLSTCNFLSNNMIQLIFNSPLYHPAGSRFSQSYGPQIQLNIT